MKQFMINDGRDDTLVLFTGEHECDKGYSFGPYIREHYLIHFCISGKGTILDKHGEHRVKAGELFIIRPGEVTTYTADEREPWHYIWIAFSGSIGDRLLDIKTVNKTPEGIAERLASLVDIEEDSSLLYKSIVYELIYRLTTNSEGENDYRDKLSKIRRYIKYNYMQRLRISEIAAEFGFDRSYLYRSFKMRYGIGVKEYIIKVRLERARELLRSGYNVGESAHLVGYEDEFNFSKTFKQYFGISPAQMKNKKLK